MSALHPKADMCGALADVRFGPKADMCSAKRHVRFTPKSDIKCDIAQGIAIYINRLKRPD